MAVSGCSNSPEASVAFCKTGIGRSRSPAGRQGQSQFQVDPRLRPVVGLSGAACKVAMRLSISGSWAASGPSSSPRRRMARAVQRTISAGSTGNRLGGWTTPPCWIVDEMLSCPCPKTCWTATGPTGLADGGPARGAASSTAGSARIG